MMSFELFGYDQLEDIGVLLLRKNQVIFCNVIARQWLNVKEGERIESMKIVQPLTQASLEDVLKTHQEDLKFETQFEFMERSFRVS